MRKRIGTAYALIMAAYFLVSGGSALLDVPAKLERVGLRAIDDEGQAAFIVIYGGLMIGIGVACLLIQRMSKTWFYSALLATTVLSSILALRVVGILVTGSLSSLHATYLVVEVVEVALGVSILWGGHISPTKA